jgi:hypothetical protein
MKKLLPLLICFTLFGCRPSIPKPQLPDIASEQSRYLQIIASKDKKEIESLFIGAGLDPDSSKTIKDQIFRRLTAGTPEKHSPPVEVAIKSIGPHWIDRLYAIKPTHEIQISLRYIEGGNMIGATESYPVIAAGDHFYIVWPLTVKK